MPRTSENNPQAAFTLVEMLVVIPMVVVIIGVIIGMLVSLVGSVVMSNGKTRLVYDTQSALSQIEQDVFLSTAFISSYTPPSPQGEDNSTAAFTSVSNDIILNQYGTVGNPMDPAREAVYYANRPNVCSGSDYPLNQPFYTKIVYFIKNNTLYRRTIVPLWNTNATPDGDTVCKPVWQRGSCVSINYLSSTRCKASDMALITNVSSVSMAVSYYNKIAPSTIVADPGAADSMKVTLSVASKAAGDAISYTTTLAASKTGTQTATVSSTPGSPTINISSYFPPGRAIFTWTPVDKASSYDIKYSNNNGASWSAVTNVPATNTDLTYTSNKDIFGGETLQVSVTAKNDLGSGTPTVAVFGPAQNPIWKPCGPIAPALNYGADAIVWADAGYTYTSAGVVMIRGRVKNISAFTTICTLPEGYRPDYHTYYRAYTGTQPANTEIFPDGRVAVSSTQPTWHSLDGAFIPAGTSYTWTTVGLQNSWSGWSTYGSNPYAPPRYTVDSMGRTHLEFMLTPGTTTDNTIIASISNASVVGAKYMHIPSASDNFSTGTTAKNAIGVNPAGSALEIRAKGNNVGWIKLHTMLYTGTPGGANGGSWTDIALQNSTNYDTTNFTTASYAKAADGIVMLRGLIRPSVWTNGTTLATLPDAYCPDKGSLIPVNNDNSTGVIQVTPSNGTSCTLQLAIGSGTVLGFDGVFWKAYK